MKKSILNSFTTGVIIGVAAGILLEAFLSDPKQPAPATPPKKPTVDPNELIGILDRQRIIAVADERFEHAARLRDRILKLKLQYHAEN